MTNNYTLYCLTNKLNNKKYFGITKQILCKRWKRGKGYKPTTKIAKAINEYGWQNFEHKIVMTNLTREEAEKQEIEHINKYNTIYDGYNTNTGGFNGVNNFVTNETRERLSESHKGQHSSVRTEFKKGQKTTAHFKIMKKVRCIDTGIVYNSIKEAEEKLNISHHIWECVQGLRKKCGGYKWEYVKGDEI